MNFNFNNQDFKDVIKRKEHDILLRTSQGIQETDVFQQLYSSLITYLKSRAFNDVKVLVINKESIDKLRGDYYDKLSITLDSQECVLHNYVVLNEGLEIIDKARDHKYQNTNEAHRLYREISKDYVVFVLLPHANVIYFIDGNDFGDYVFLTSEDIKSYEEKKGIDKIGELFDDYRIHLKTRDTYNKFFVSKSHLKSMYNDLNPKEGENDFIKNHCHLLENTPEDRFREDLRYFLKGRLKATFVPKEYTMADLKRLDIAILDESGNELYFIEVKWVGISIHKEGKKFGTSYEEKNIVPAAVKQTVGYLKQLHEEQNNIKLGYLTVFDARKDDLPDTCSNLVEDIFDDEDKMHYAKFIKIPDFRVKNYHPS